ncbi:hypothetical protein GGR28_001918 [Lewinella aquimaris]|uniref:Uncharacterized protein n=1 Tax=Neolewinella aquimaris TaxID=1835722 RepID=A0A840EBB2_9BACT|nr:hypothetical protein [Neolewinella aquimaris]
MNNSTPRPLGHAEGQPKQILSTVRKDCLPATESGTAAPRYSETEEENFRLNQEEARQLCTDFRAFYAANTAYQIDL